ncbi:MAG: hypothetical protein GY859_01905 [Desulfobacterales bacterium]|nr:hypothetical protein [Desulfobacterales bacterium]
MKEMVQRIRRIPRFPSLLMILMLAVSCSDTPLKEYTCMNQEEKEILALLIENEDARNSFDVERYFATLHDNGQYHFACRVMLSKEELRKSLPQFWDRLRAGDLQVYPMCRENLTGNYFLKGRLYNPEIEIERDAARIKLTYSSWGFRLIRYIHARRDNDRWLINRLDWGDW